MKTVKIMLIISLQLVLMSNSCKNNSYYDFRLKVINKSDKTIYADFYQSYPDTILSMHSHFDNSANKAVPNGIVTLVRGGTWETAFKGNIQQKLMIFIFDAATVDNTPWDTIRKNYLILKRYDLSLKELDSLNFKVTYP